MKFIGNSVRNYNDERCILRILLGLKIKINISIIFSPNILENTIIEKIIP